MDPETKEFSSEEKADYAKFLNEMARINPDLLKSGYMNLNAAQLRAKVPTGMSFRDYLRQTRDYQTNVKNLADPNLSPERAVYSAFGDDGGQGFQEFVKNYRELAILRSTGLGDIPNELKPFASILDGVMADGQLSAEEMQEVRTKLAGFLQSGYKLESNKSLFDMVRGIGQNLVSANYATLWEKVRDGTLTADEAAGVVAGDTAGSNLSAKLYDLLNSKGLTVAGDVKGILATGIRDRTTKAIADLVVDPALIRGGIDSVTKLNELKNAGLGPVSERLTRLEAALPQLQRMAGSPNPVIRNTASEYLKGLESTIESLRRIKAELSPKTPVSTAQPAPIMTGFQTPMFNFGGIGGTSGSGGDRGIGIS